MLLTNPTATDPYAREKEARLEEIGRIIRMPFGVDKLQTIAGLWMSDPQNGPGNRYQMLACAEVAKELRETRLNKFGSSADPNAALSRLAFSPPVGLVMAIETFCGDEAWNGREGKRNWAVFKRAFPQFMASEVY